MQFNYLKLNFIFQKLQLYQKILVHRHHVVQIAFAKYPITKMCVHVNLNI